MDKKELEKLISEMERKARKESRRRICIVIAAFTIVSFFMFCLFEGKPEDFNELFSYLLASLMISGINLGIYEFVYEPLFAKEQAAENEIKALKKELYEIEKHKKE